MLSLNDEYTVATLTTCKACGCNDVGWFRNDQGGWTLLEGSQHKPAYKGTNYRVFKKDNIHVCN